jgi:polyribonucleotide nucleotidyltransferase
MGTPSRREIGHGALAERALLGVIPSPEVFPYTIQVNSEVLASNGSTSMASTCGSTMALMAAGVPILAPVAGIAMGLVSTDEKYVILTDILGLEDFSGDMDFKVTGTEAGVTAIQLDVKTLGLTLEQIKEVFDRARSARLQVLKVMLKAISKPRSEVSVYAPKIAMVKIPVEKIGELIGPGGKNIKHIMATTGTTIDVEDDGSVSITGMDEESAQKAVTWISGMTREVHAGEIFEDAEVKRILPFGAFVEFLPGKEGMVHVSKMSATQYVNNPADVVQIGDKVKVRVLEIDDQGRVNLTMLFGEQPNSEGGEGGQSAEDGQPQRPPFQPMGQNVGPGQRSMHPLSQQFRRERSGTAGPRRGGFGGRSNGGFKRRDDRTGSSEAKPRYRKSHY